MTGPAGGRLTTEVRGRRTTEARGRSMHRTWRRIAVLAAGTLLRAAPALAQVVRGVVVDPADVPVPGVVVQLMDAATNGAAARALTNERGEYRLAPPRPGTYQLHTLRIGFRPVSSEPIALRSGETVTRRLVLTGVPFSLAAVRVEGRSSCRAMGDAAAATFAVWEQARSALTATQLTAGERAVMATTVTYERTMDPLGRRVLEQTASVQSAFVAQPWRSLGPDAVRADGYVSIDRDGWTTYSAPGLDVLLSTSFLEDHCFRLVAGRGQSEVGIAFEPTRERTRNRAVAEIRGTLWLDRASAELRRLEFRYVNLSAEQEAVAGGELAFVRLADGAWAISRWGIRMPALEQGFRAQRSIGSAVRVAAIKVAGGELALATRGTDTLWARAPVVLAGAVLDAASGNPAAGARVRLAGTPLADTTDERGRFRIAGVLPGSYTLEVGTASLDSVRAAYPVPLEFTDSATTVEVRVPTAAQMVGTVCAKTRFAPDAPGILVGSVSMRGDSMPPRNVKVFAEWTDLSLRGTRGAVVDRQRRWFEARTDSRGEFRMCGVPVNTALTLRAESDSAGGAPVDVRIPPNGRFAHVELLLDRMVAGVAVFSGAVFADSTQRAIAGAEIVLPELQKAVLTDEAGAFRVGDVTPGPHRVQVRRLGFGPLDTTITFAANQTVDRRIYLHRVVTLDSVTVVAERVVIPSFEEHRRIGLGHFFTRDELAKQEGRRLSDVLTQLPGIKLVSGVGNKSWVATGRGPRSLNPQCRVREGETKLDPPDCSCYAAVYVDKVLVSRTEVPNINRFAPGDIEAIEYFASPAQTPIEYTELNSQCGVVVIHTRRSP